MNLDIRNFKFPYWNMPFLTLIKKSLKALNVSYNDVCCNDLYEAQNPPIPALTYREFDGKIIKNENISVIVNTLGGYDFEKIDVGIYKFTFDDVVNSDYITVYATPYGDDILRDVRFIYTAETNDFYLYIYYDGELVDELGDDDFFQGTSVNIRVVTP